MEFGMKGRNILVDHLTSVLGGVLHGVATSLMNQLAMNDRKEFITHTEISQAWPSAIAQ
jgi:hypothetical protein